MATASKKGRSSKESDKKSPKRTEDTPTLEDKIETLLDPEIQGSVIEEEQLTPEEPPPKEPTPEPVYEEPVLTQLIVESYDGDKAKGLYDGAGEAFFTGGHHYKGEFSEGLMHGKGSYTWSDRVLYEGEFNRNQVTGKGQYSWPDGSTYDGDVSNGLRHGFGSFCCGNKRMSYTGEWNLGTRHGKGRMEYDSEGLSFYEGDWVESIRHGFGMRRYASGNVYQGMWDNNIRHGEGTMRWLDRDQMYTGQWHRGVQHGVGQHIWFLRRMPGSQYPLRNMYDGEFVQGKRQGFGTFYYANGARYEGEWQDNLKCGKGKFVFKNGRVYEGTFDKDHIMEFPEFQMDGVTTPDLTQIRTRTPLPTEQMSIHSNDSQNTYSPSFQMDVDHLLQEFPETDREEEATQVVFVIMRHISNLRKIYSFYSCLGYDDSPDNTFVMNRMQFWRFLKDCQLHHQDITLMEMDRALALDKSLEGVEEMHNPYGKILLREFINSIVTLAAHIYQSQHEGTGPLLAWCLSKMISNNVLRHSCSVKGYIYRESRRAANSLVHMDEAFTVYTNFSSPRKFAPHEPALKMRQFLFLMKDLKLINNDLPAKSVIEILASDDPKVMDEDGCINLELEMTFMEFFDALVGCAELFVTEAVVKDPSSPRPSTTLTQERTMSVPCSASRGASHAGGLDDRGRQDGVTLAGSSPQLDGAAGSGAGSPNQGRSMSQMTTKTADGSDKLPEVQSSNITNASAADTQGPSTTRLDTAKKSEMSLGAAKKSASFMSSHSLAGEAQPGALVHSVISMPSELGMVDAETEEEEDEEEEEEELDEETRQFNFWTHQVHIFFVRKFLLAAQRLVVVQKLIEERLAKMPDQPLEEELLLQLLLQQEEEEGLKEAQEAEAAASGTPGADPDAVRDTPQQDGKVARQTSKADSTSPTKDSSSPTKQESVSRKESRTRKSGKKK